MEELIFDEQQGIDQPLELAIVGVIYTRKNGIGRFPNLRPEHFTKLEIQRFFEVAHKIAIEGDVPDIMAGYSKLKGMGLDMSQVNYTLFAEAMELPDVRVAASTGSASIEKRMIRLWQKREAIQLGKELATGELDIQEMQERVADIANGASDQGREAVGDVALRVLEQSEINLVARRNNLPLPNAVYPGIRPMDYVGGFRTGDLVLLAARPAMGKSTVARFMGTMIANRFPLLFLTEEMTKEEVVSLMGSSYAQLKQTKVRKMDLTDEEYSAFIKGVTAISQLEIEIDYLDELFSLIAKMRAWRMATADPKKPAVVIIDYIQQIRVDNNSLNKVQKIGLVSTMLKSVAKHLNIVIIALAQLSRGPETRAGDKRPILSDLRDSGELEQDADIVIFLYRPEYYGFETDDEGSSTMYMVEAIYAKNRHGPPGTVKFHMDMGTGRVIDPTDYFSGSEKKLRILPGQVNATEVVILPPLKEDDVPF